MANRRAERQAEFEQRRAALLASLPPEPPRKKIKLRLPKLKLEPTPEKPPRVCLICEERRDGWQFVDRQHDICWDCRRPARTPFTWGNGMGTQDLARLNTAMAVIGVLQNGGKAPIGRRGATFKTIQSD